MTFPDYVFLVALIGGLAAFVVAVWVLLRSMK